MFTQKCTHHQILNWPLLHLSEVSITLQIISPPTDCASSLVAVFLTCYKLRLQLVFFPIAIPLTMQFYSPAHDNIA